jgi:hypothetical protein
MFFITYVRRELSRRMHQAIFVALGQALGIGLVITVSSASAGVKTAEASVLGALDGVGTDVTVTGPAPKAHLWRERGFTLVLVTHDAATARRAQRTARASR